MILAFDTCLGSCSVAAGDAQDMRACRYREMRRGHAEALMPMIAETLKAAGLAPAEVDRIAVVCGPGSFTGIRVGIAAARGLALALAVPAAAVTSLELLAAAAAARYPGTPVLAAIAARGERLYHQPFDDRGHPEASPALSEMTQAAKHYEGRRGVAIGSGAGDMAARLAGLDSIAETDAPPAALLLALADRLDPARWTGRPSPLYLRPPDARLPAGLPPGAA